MTPEQYWIDRGEDVIGTDVLKDGEQARQAATYQAIAQWIVEHKIWNVLDVGCNVAALHWFLRKAGYKRDYLGVDSNAYALRVAAENVVQFNLRKLPVNWSKMYHCVVVKDVIEHLEGPHLLAEAFRVARDYVIVATYIPWTDEPAEIVQHPDGYYTNRYNTGEVLAYAAEWGFGNLGAIATREANGTDNAIYVFRRKQVAA